MDIVAIDRYKMQPEINHRFTVSVMSSSLTKVYYTHHKNRLCKE